MIQALQTTETGIQAAVRRAGTQAGISLLELIAALTVIAAIIVGALALYTSASTTQSSTQLVQDTISLRSAIQQLYQGQGSYGATNADLNAVLNNAKRVPSTIRVVPGNPPTFLLPFSNGASQSALTATAQSGGTQFRLRLTNIPQAVCISLMTTSSGWISVTGQSGGARTPPVTPAIANSSCTAAFGQVDLIGS